MGGGVMAEGRRQRAMKLAVIADIALIARNRKSKGLPLINRMSADRGKPNPATKIADIGKAKPLPRSLKLP